ncbi:MAG: MYXO-CTERM sorting domain-containing protein [Myxococcota bacterium]
MKSILIWVPVVTSVAGLVPVAADAQRFRPAPEDLVLVAPILADRLDLVPERIVHVAPGAGPDGDGSVTNPRRDLISAVEEAEAGTAVHLAPGVYDMSAIRDAFGHPDGALFTGADGEPGRPIVVRTDPDRYDPDAGEIAILDFNYENEAPGWRTSSFVARHDYWVFERFEMRRMQNRGFWAQGHDLTFRELHLHHVDTPGTNNDGLILMAASGGGIDNVVMDSHLHHAGEIDRATDTLLSRGAGNGGCFYSETRFTYDSGEPAGGHDATRAEWEASLVEPDGDVYLVGNEVHDCYYGLGLKNHSRGPYYFLSNHVYDAEAAIFTPFRDNTIRNNIVRGSITIGRAATDRPQATFFKMTGNGNFSEVSYNTVIGGQLVFRGGWGTVVHHNLVVDRDDPVAVIRNQFYWWEDGDWPGVRGEFLIGDLDASHPFYNLMPGYMRETPGEFPRMQLSNNCYTSEPVIARADFVQSTADVTGMTFDEDYIVLNASQRTTLFVDEGGGDYRGVDNNALDCGSRIGTADPLPPTDGGVSDGGLMPVDAGRPDSAPDATADEGSRRPSDDGCGCSAAQGDDTSGALTVVLSVLVVTRRRQS